MALGLYMAAMTRMPNRAYLPYLTTIDSANLQSVLINMLAYGLVEFASLFLLCAMLRRQLGFSPIAQLKMVLRTRWRPVQAALIFLLIINVQAPLEHYGALHACIAFSARQVSIKLKSRVIVCWAGVDNSFKFAWLSGIDAERQHRILPIMAS
jgi:hypothetical protein